jgi:hypothetical protein
VFDPGNIRQVALALRTVERYVEKDWHLVRAVSVIASLDVEGVVPAFSGGTSLATAWQLIHRFSEDIDFKVTVQAGSASAGRRIRSAYRDAVIEALTKAGFRLDGVPLIGNMSRFFRASFHYGAIFPAATGIRSSLQIELSFTGTRMPPTPRPARSLLGHALKAPAEVPALLCVDPVETAADKISALAWRSSVRNRNSKDDDPSVVRHLHDLAALAPIVGGRPELPRSRSRSSMPMHDAQETMMATGLRCCAPCCPCSLPIRYGGKSTKSSSAPYRLAATTSGFPSIKRSPDARTSWQSCWTRRTSSMLRPYRGERRPRSPCF